MTIALFLLGYVLSVAIAFAIGYAKGSIDEMHISDPVAYMKLARIYHIARYGLKKQVETL